MSLRFVRWTRPTAAAALLILMCASGGHAQTADSRSDQAFEYADTSALVSLVNDAAALVRSKGAAAFADLRVAGSRWRQGETYIFVLDPDGTMLVHPEAAMEGRNQLGLTDVGGKRIIRGLIDAVTAVPDKPAGWYHYQWPVPEGLLPRWKSSYVRLVQTASGKRYIAGSGVYNDRMERAFVVDAVDDAVGAIEKHGKAAYSMFRDPTSRFVAKDAYIFVIEPDGTDVVNPAFPNLEGHNLLDLKDAQGKLLIREMLDVVRTRASGWVDYMWPKPGESVSTQKSTYVRKAKIGAKWVMVGSGVYLADAPKAVRRERKMTAPELMALVRDASALLEKDGEQAFAAFRTTGSKWLHDDTYLFVWAMDGTCFFHATDPAREGRNDAALKDTLGRPFGTMFLDVASSPSGEGWVHYVYPEPGNIFPAWKSTFVKRVTFPSGQQMAVGSGIYNMQMDKAFIEDLVNRAATLVAARGTDAFGELRDKTGPFIFMDTYVFVDTPQGIELVNPAQPSVEGKNLLGLTDLKGKPLVDEYVALAMKDGSGWVDYYWYKPGHNTQARKVAYVRKVEYHGDTYIVGSGFYVEPALVPDNLDSVKVDAAHHQVVFENDQVRVVRWVIPERDKTLNHSHPSNLSVVLTDYNGKVTTPDGMITDVYFKSGSVTWREAGAHVVENLGQEPMTGIIIEPKKPASARPVGSADPVVVDPQHQKVEFENEQIRVIRERQSGSFPMHGHPDNVQVLLTDMNASLTTGDGTTQTVTGKAGEVRWRTATQHRGKNLADEPIEQIVVEMKGVTGPRPTAGN